MSCIELPSQNVMPDELMIGITGIFFVIVLGVEAAEHPKLFVTDTVNMPEFVTLKF